MSLTEIERLSKRHSDDAAFLSELLNEVRHRTDFIATGIQLAITKRINELERKDERKGQNETSGGKAKDHSKKTNFEDSEIANLRRQLLQAQEQIASLRAQLKTSPNSDEDKLFRRVGLNKDSPDFVIHAVRRAYRMAVHPDTRPEGQKKEAHRKFIDAEEAFKKIFQLRNL